MKQCPQCSTKNKNEAKFCSGCGANLENVPILPDGTNETFSKASGWLSEGSKFVKNTTASGMEKAKDAIAAGKEKIQQSQSQSNTSPSGFTPASGSVQGSAQGSSSWEEASKHTASNKATWSNAVNLSSAAVEQEHYPFFQTDEEKTIAAIGEKDAAADLDGHYQQPYAILTEERLYVKNEAGNFVMETADILATGTTTVKVRGWPMIVMCTVYSLWALAFLFLAMHEGGNIPIGILLLILALPAVTWAGVFLHFRQKFIKAAVAICIASLPFALGALGELILFAARGGRLYFNFPTFLMLLIFPIFAAVYTVNVRKLAKDNPLFFIQCNGGSFSFLLKNYPPQEFLNFQTKIAPFCKGPVPPMDVPGSASSTRAQKTVSAYTPYPKQKRGGLIAVCIVLALTVVIGIVGYRLTHCKRSGCNEPVYAEGYCSYHYKLYVADQKAHEAYDAASSFFDGLFG